MCELVCELSTKLQKEIVYVGFILIVLILICILQNDARRGPVCIIPKTCVKTQPEELFACKFLMSLR